jgi:hypothetical protein
MPDPPATRRRSFVWRFAWIPGLALGLGWPLLLLGLTTLGLHRASSAGSRLALLLTVLALCGVLAGVILFTSRRRRAAGVVWTALAIAGAALVAAVPAPDSQRGEMSLLFCGTVALSGILTLVAGAERAVKPALIGTISFSLVVALCAWRDWADGRLWRAVQRRDLPAVASLIDHGAVVDSKAAAGVTPLMQAVDLEDAEIARLLVASGADVYRRDDRGRSAMMRALARQDDALATPLLLAVREALDGHTHHRRSEA